MFGWSETLKTDYLMSWLNLVFSSTEAIMVTLIGLINSLGDSLSRVMRKPVFGVSDQVPHKPGCAITEDGEKLEISDLAIRGIVLSM